MTLRARFLAVAFLAVSFLSAPLAGAQGVSILNPIARSYVALGFVFPAPQGDGWREIGSAPDSFRIVYAEQMGEQINTRADFAAQAFAIEEPEKVPDAYTLSRMSMAQRIEEKGEAFVALAQVQPVDGLLPLHEYTIVFKLGDKDHFEHHFVALAADKTQYLAAKLVTQEPEFRTAPYFVPLTQAMAALTFTAGAAAAPSAAGVPPDAATPPAPAAEAPAVAPPAAGADEGSSTSGH